MTLHDRMVKAGYVVSPNDIDLTGKTWYPGGPGIYDAPEFEDRIVETNSGEIRIIRGYFEKREDVAAFGSFGSFLEWVRVNGRMSEGGQPANCD